MGAFHRITAKLPTNGNYAEITLDGKPLHGVKSIEIRAGVNEATEATIKMIADVEVDASTTHRSREKAS